MSTMPRLGATELVSGQAIPETTVNENLRYVEQGAGFFIVKDKDLATPPGSPADGDAYIVAGSPTGVWTGHAGSIAFYMNTGWLFVVPIEGTHAAVQDEDVNYRYNGSAWAVPAVTGALLAANNLSDLASASTARVNLGVYYRVGFFFTTTPSASEVLALHVVTDAITIPANFASPDSKGSCGTNPTASFALDVQKNGASIGTITISTGGAFTFATTSGTSKSFAAGDVLKVVAPGVADATCANVAITLKGTI